VGSESGQRTARRVPPLAIVAWAIAAACFVGLALAVAHYLSAGTGGGMAGMQMDAAHQLTRAGGDPAGPLLSARLLTRWQVDAVALVVLVLLGAWYLTLVALVGVRHPGTTWPVRRTVWFFTGLAVCGFATNGSIAVYDQVLFTAHMLGHLALVMVAPAMFVMGGPLRLALEASTPRSRARLEKALAGPVLSVITSPPVALAVYCVVIVGSHLTGLMDTIMRNDWAGQVEHAVYVIAGYLFFTLVIGDEPIRWRLSTPARWVMLVISMAVDTFTGLVLLQGSRVIQMQSSPAVSVDPLADTHTGGAIMWFGGDAIMAFIMIILVIGWLRRADTSSDEAAPDTGWLEQARRSAFAAHVDPEAEANNLDLDSDAARDSYNAWLAKINRDG
jgi:putative copper resistance protein D